MKPCDAIRESLIDLRYGLLDADAARDARAHLSGCAACAAAMEALETLDAALAPRSSDRFGREAEVDWERFARTTVRRAMGRAAVRDARPGWLGRLLAAPGAWAATAGRTTVPAWAGVAAMLVVVIGLSLLTYTQFPVPVKAPVSDGAAEVVMPEANIDNLTVNLARENTAEYLRQTRAVLVSMMDVDIHCDQGKVDISAERAKASMLLRRQRLIAAELDRMPLARAQDVCNDLEKLLLEVASLADCARDDDVRTIRDVVEKRQILVRMELLSQELARRGGAHV